MTSNLCKSTTNIYLSSSEVELVGCPLPLKCKHHEHCCVAGVNLQDFSGSLVFDQLSLVAASCDLINLIPIDPKATFDLSGHHLTWTLLDSKFKTGFIYLKTDKQAKFMRLCPSKLTYEFCLKENETAQKFVLFLKVKHVNLTLCSQTECSLSTFITENASILPGIVTFPKNISSTSHSSDNFLGPPPVTITSNKILLSFTESALTFDLETGNEVVLNDASATELCCGVTNRTGFTQSYDFAFTKDNGEIETRTVSIPPVDNESTQFNFVCFTCPENLLTTAKITRTDGSNFGDFSGEYFAFTIQ